jgi:hypothetical protein
VGGGVGVGVGVGVCVCVSTYIRTCIHIYIYVYIYVYRLLRHTHLLYWHKSTNADAAHTQVADELAEVFRKDIAAGWNGSCGIHTQHGPVPQVIERKDPSERPAQPAAQEAKEKEEFHSDFHTESGRGAANAQQQAQSRSPHTPSKADL